MFLDSHQIIIMFWHQKQKTATRKLVSVFRLFTSSFLYSCRKVSVMDLHILSLGTLVPEGPWCVFCATRHQVYLVLTLNRFFAGTWFDTHTQACTHACKHAHTHTNSQRQHMQGSLDWHTHVNIYLHHLLCAHSSYLFYIEWIIQWYQKFTIHNVFSFHNVFTRKVILDDIRLGSSCETQIILIEMV